MRNNFSLRHLLFACTKSSFFIVSSAILIPFLSSQSGLASNVLDKSNYKTPNYPTNEKEFVPKNEFTGSLPDTVDNGTQEDSEGKEKERGFFRKNLSRIGIFIAPITDFFFDREYEDDRPLNPDGSPCITQEDYESDTRPISPDGSPYNKEKEPFKGFFRPLFNFLFGEPVDVKQCGTQVDTETNLKRTEDRKIFTYIRYFIFSIWIGYGIRKVFKGIRKKIKK